MAKFRVYEIAKKYNKDNKEILEILKANHVEVKNHMSTKYTQRWMPMMTAKCTK